jgi:hypothetical protein
LRTFPIREARWPDGTRGRAERDRGDGLRWRADVGIWFSGVRNRIPLRTHVQKLGSPWSVSLVAVSKARRRAASGVALAAPSTPSVPRSSSPCAAASHADSPGAPHLRGGTARHPTPPPTPRRRPPRLSPAPVAESAPPGARRPRPLSLGQALSSCYRSSRVILRHPPPSGRSS